jgi:hypothetical protein|tara:strand:- start:63 stop:269 length:207 start_codon:yes stop_codon:yes gene_type:complete
MNAAALTFAGRSTTAATPGLFLIEFVLDIAIMFVLEATEQPAAHPRYLVGIKGQILVLRHFERDGVKF